MARGLTPMVAVDGARRAISEARRLMALATSSTERLSVAGFLAALYVARFAPFDAYGCSRRVRLKGLTWQLGVRTSEIYILEEVYTHAMYDRVPDYIPEPGWFIVDAGANAGVFSVLSASRGARLVAVEPNQQSFERLVGNVRDNEFAGMVQPVHAALGAHSGSGSLLVQDGGTTGGVLVEHAAETGAPWIRVCTLDEIVDSAGAEQIDLLKIDIEGSEVEALRGAERTLSRTRRIIYEYHSAALLAGMREILTGHGFREDLQFVYYPEGASEDGEEVGMVYAARADDGE